MPLQPGKCQIAHTFALTKILANTPTVPEKTQATRAFTAPRGGTGQRTLLRLWEKSGSVRLCSAEKKYRKQNLHPHAAIRLFAGKPLRL